MQPPGNNIYDSRPTNLFDNQFVAVSNPAVQSNFQPEPSGDPAQMNERDRRIYLRDKERAMRSQLPPGAMNAPIVQVGQYGGADAAAKVQDIFGQQPVQSQRDLMLALKAQQRQQQMQQPPVQMNQQPPQYQPYMQAPVQQQMQQPEYGQLQQKSQLQSPSPRQSMTAMKLLAAKNLDSSVNQISQQDLQQPASQFQIGHDQDQRRALQNRQRQQDYQEHMVAQARPSGQYQSMPQEPLVQAGLAQIGEHQYRQADNKMKQQLEYKRMLEEQQQQLNKLQKGTPPLAPSKKQQIADQVFNQVVDSHRGAGSRQGHRLPVQDPYSMQQQPSHMPSPGQRAHSARGANRQLEVQKLQMQNTKDMFGADEDSRRRKEQEKKREYAAILQEQMNQKKAQLQKGASPRGQMREPSPRHQQMAPLYAAQHLPQRMQDQQQYYQPPVQQAPFEGNSPYGNQAVDPYYGNSAYEPPHANYQQQEMMPSALQRNQSQPAPSGRGQPASNTKEDYRRILEQQMKEAADKKVRAKEEKMQYDLRYNKDTAEVIAEGHKAQGRRGHSDITKLSSGNDEQKAQAILKYQEELKQQMDQQKQNKEMLAKRAKQEEFVEEQRLQRERDMIANRDRVDIQKEGGKVTEDSKSKKQINRSQFERSDEQSNPSAPKPPRPAVVNSPAQQFKSKLPQTVEAPVPSQAQNEDPFGAPFGGMPAPGTNPQAFNVGPPPYSQPQQFAGFAGAPQQQFQVQPHPQSQQMFAAPGLLAAPMAMPQPQPQMMVGGAPGDWQQQQASKMFEDQQKMIVLYQQALEQILKYRNQYFEQAMDMRENVLKEREQQLQFEQLKQQQLSEMQQLQAVKNQLGSVQATQQGLTPAVQQNLNKYIVDQKSQLLDLSQSAKQMDQMMKQAQAELKMHQQPSFRVETSMVQIERPLPTQPPHPMFNQNQIGQQELEKPLPTHPPGERPLPTVTYSDPDDRPLQNKSPRPMFEFGNDVHAQIDDIAQHVNRLGQEQKNQTQNSLDFEVSLNSHSKMVRVPQNNLVAKAQQLKQTSQSPTGQRGQPGQSDLMATWNATGYGQPAPNNQSNSGLKSKSPFRSSSTAIQPIQEENVASGLVSPHNRPSRPSEQGFNDRESSDERQRQTIESNEKLQSKMLSTQGQLERKAVITGSSFYDKTMQNQKKQAETQVNEWNQQMQRIFGNTLQSAAIQVRDDDQTTSLHQITEDHENEKKTSIRNGATFEGQFQINIANTMPDRVINQQMVQRQPLVDEDEDQPMMPVQRQSRQKWGQPQNVASKPSIAASQDRSADNKSMVSQFHEQSVEQMSSSQKTFVYKPTPSDWDRTNGTDFKVPVVFSHEDAGPQSPQQFLQEFNHQYQGEAQYNEYIYEEEEDATLRDLKLLSPPSVIKTQNQSEFQRQLEQPIERSQQIEEDIEVYEVDPELKAANDQLLRRNKQNLHSDITTSMLSDRSAATHNKEQEMMEIAALIRKAQATTDHAVETSTKRKKEQRRITPTRTRSYYNAKPIVEESERGSSYGGGGLQDEGQTILADLDRIINNLEQQKNMATFGMQEEQPADQSHSHTTQWKTLQEARDAARPTTSKSNKAPLAPKRQQDNDTKSRTSNSRLGDASPQRVGKFSQMALANQTNMSDKSQDKSQTSKSPQRVGKFAQMAIDNSIISMDRSQISKSPQRVGKFAQMAIDNSMISQDKSAISKSPQRVGKFAQMAIDNSMISHDNQERSHTSKSPQRVGKFAQMAIDNSMISQKSKNTVSPRLGKFAQLAVENKNDVSQDDIDQISQKYSPARMNSSKVSQNKSELLVPQHQQSASSILRPVSGQHSSRYQRPTSTVQTQKVAPQNLSQYSDNYGASPGRFTTLSAKQKALLYDSDEEDEMRPRTELTDRV